MKRLLCFFGFHNMVSRPDPLNEWSWRVWSEDCSRCGKHSHGIYG